MPHADTVADRRKATAPAAIRCDSERTIQKAKLSIHFRQNRVDLHRLGPKSRVQDSFRAKGRTQKSPPCRSRAGLTESQRAMVASRLAKMPKGRPSENASIEAISQQEAASQLNVGRSSVQRAAEVRDSGSPELNARIAGEDYEDSGNGLMFHLPGCSSIPNTHSWAGC